MLLDQNQEQKKPTVSGNNQLLKGSVFGLISLCWFSFIFAFINMDWVSFSPFAPFYGIREKGDYIFYFIAFGFFISSLIYTTVFYRNNLQPTDLLLRFAMIIIVFVLLYLAYQFSSVVMVQQKRMAFGAFGFLPQEGNLMKLANILVTFLFLYMLFYPLIMFFGKVFFNGFFGTAGFFLTFFITAIFHVSMYLLADLEEKLMLTAYPISDVILILFFTLLSFGIGVISGEEEKRKKIAVRSQSHFRHLRGE